MTDRATIAAIAAIRGRLYEARRHTQARPDAARMSINRAIRDLTSKAIRMSMPLPVDHAICCLFTGMDCIRAAPDVTDATITLALWVLGGWESELRKAEGEEERDRELAEAYGKDGDR